MNTHKRIYRALVNLLEKEELTRSELVYGALSAMTGTEQSGAISVGKESELRGGIGTVIDEMLSLGIIEENEEGLYALTSKKSVALRIEKCEKEILLFLSTGAHTRAEIRQHLESLFGTNKTSTKKDDNILFSYIGQILKRLIAIGIVTLNDKIYEIAPQKRASIGDISQYLTMKSDFLSALHARGGEYFEHYFMTLLGKYLVKHGEAVTENYTTGGASDGGIDGIIKTVDSLGFRETVMVQTKNRLSNTSETEVRGFYGAVCAKQGSRGVFATSSDFHPSAVKFLEGIDNCVGIDADKLFDMALECQYGIKKQGGQYHINLKNVL